MEEELKQEHDAVTETLLKFQSEDLEVMHQVEENVLKAR